MPLVLLDKIKCLSLEDTLLQTSDLMIPIFLRLVITNNLLGSNLQIRKLELNLKIQSPKLEHLNQEQITLPLSINQKKEPEKCLSLEVTVVSIMKEKHIRIFTVLMLRPLNGLSMNQAAILLLFLIAEVVILQQ